MAALAAGWTGWLTRPPGPGLSPDGMSYLGAARSIASGHGPRVPFAWWADEDSTDRLREYPPGFPALIAAFSLPSRPAESGGRLVEIVSAAALAFGMVVLLGRSAGPLTGALATLAFLITPAFLADYSIVLSEPPFLVVLVLVLGLLAMDNSPAWLVGLACAAGVMTRYVGLFLAGAAALWFLLRPGSLVTRLGRSLLAALPSLALFVLWDRWAGGARLYGWKAGFLETLAQGSVTVQTWLAPWSESPLPRALLALLIAGLIVAAVARAEKIESRSGRGRRLRRAAGLLALGFALMMILSRLFADEAIIFDDRLISPLLLLGVIVTASACGDAWPTLSGSTRALVGVLLFGWLAGTAMLDVPPVKDLLEDGWGYASIDWQSSEIAQWLRADGRRYSLFSDNPPATWSLIHRPSRLIPDSTTPAVIRDFAAALGAHPSALISYAHPYSPEDPRAAWFARRLGWTEVLRSDEATVWISPAYRTAK